MIRRQFCHRSLLIQKLFKDMFSPLYNYQDVLAKSATGYYLYKTRATVLESIEDKYE